ncbi:hypothetical protein ACFO26_04280 [Lactococcus nasutitermitis]|uniref:SseB protein N-terminal domain-containing protein n=1 Tax=Lactococcus nasutitermitis TaxID=1652957 RepID=A0ABV9JDU7_9LACT|nr:hypothetical protein [Lactococcus nasutitermitis]
MNKYNLNSDVDEKLRASLENPAEFLTDLSFTYALQGLSILVPAELFYVEIEGKKAVPVFTTEQDLDIFMANLNDVNTDWTTQKLNVLLDTLMPTELEVIAFNPKLSMDENRGNTAYFEKNSLLTFLNHYTEILNAMLNPENQKTERLSRTYLVPTFLWKDDNDAIHRGFESLTAGDEQDYIPIFDNLDSFSTWYNSEFFGEPFQENNGQVLVMTFSELLEPKEAENIFGKTVGVTINPLDVDIEDYQKTIITWEELR